VQFEQQDDQLKVAEKTSIRRVTNDPPVQQEVTVHHGFRNR
jgi:hypothetical protein